MVHRGAEWSELAWGLFHANTQTNNKMKIRQDGARKCTSSFPKLLWLVSELCVLATLVIVPIQVQGLQQSIVC